LAATVSHTVKFSDLRIDAALLFLEAENRCVDDLVR
jgi:hypothetical protein